DRSVEEDDLMLVALDAGAEDIADDGEVWRITTAPTDVSAVRSAIEEAGIEVRSSELTMVPTSTVAVDTEEAARKILKLVDALDDNDDVQDVYGNFDIPDSVLESVGA